MTYPPSHNDYSIAVGTSPSREYIFADTPPLTTDVNYPLLQKWFNVTDQGVYILTAFSSSGGTVTATWIPLGGGETSSEFVTDSGTATPSLGVINLLGTAAQGISSSGAGSTVTYTIADSSTTQKGVAELATDAETIAGTDNTRITTSEGLKAKLGTQTANAVSYGTGTTAALGWTNALTDGQLVIGSTASSPQAANLTSSDSSITITNGSNTIDLVVGAGHSDTFDADTGSATPAAGVLNVFGSNLVETTGAGSTLTIDTPNAFADEAAPLNTALGFEALSSITGGQNNTAVGVRALQANTNGIQNTALGLNASQDNTEGDSNVAVGGSALADNTTGDHNTVVGGTALTQLVSGSRNTVIGRLAGFLYTGSESDNILIGENVVGVAAESNVLRIGSNINSVFIDGIRGTITGAANALAVQVDSNNKVTQNASTNVLTDLYVDNLQLNGNTLSSTNTDGNIVLTPDGTGLIDVQKDLEVSRANVANPVTGKVENTDNTDPGSSSIARIAVGGTSGGSPMIVYEIPAGSSWTHGADNGDSDTWKLAQSDAALATNTVLSATTGGHVTIPTTGSVGGVLGAADTFTVTGDGAGDIQMSVRNADATTGSTRHYLLTAASSTGQLIYSTYPETVATWSWGNATSASNAWKLSGSADLGTNDTLIATTSGNLTVPRTSAFSAFLTTTDTNATGDGTAFLLGNSSVGGNGFTERFDQNGNFMNAATAGGVFFTAPVAGKYLVGARIKFTSLDVNHTSAEIAFIASTLGTIIVYEGNPGAARNAGSILTIEGTGFLSLAASETVHFRVNVSGSTKTVGIGDSTTEVWTKLEC